MIEFTLNDEAINFYLNAETEDGAPDGVRLLENGWYRLLEDGGYRLLEDISQQILMGSETIFWGDTTITFSD